MEQRQRLRILGSFVLPPILVLLLFAVAIAVFILPAAEDALMQKKQDTVKAIVVSASSILAGHAEQVRAGKLSLAEAQQLALAEMRSVRYGDDGQEYLWLIDRQPKMLMHPYFPEMEGMELAAYTDARGKPLFAEAVALIAKSGEGFIDYVWAKGGNKGEVVPKLSYVKLLEPWGWIVGSGIYLDDVRRELGDFSRNLWMISAAIGGLSLLLLLFVVHSGWKSEKGRYLAEKELLSSRERYRALSRGSEELIFLVIGGAIAAANKKARESLKMSEEELLGKNFAPLVIDPSGMALIAAMERGEEAVPAEAVIRGQAGELRLLLSAQRVEVDERPAILYTGRELTAASREEGGRVGELLGGEGFGLLRVDLGAGGRVLAADGNALRLLTDADQPLPGKTTLAELFAGEDGKRLLHQLRSGETAGGAGVAVAGRPARHLRVWSLLASGGVGEGEEALLLLDDDSSRHRHGLALEGLVGARLAPQRLLDGNSGPGPAAGSLGFAMAGAMVARAMDHGLRVERATAILARSLEEIFCQAVAEAIGELGEPPCAFVLLGLGSIGRGEAMLAPDQDTAILYDQDGEGDHHLDYFRRMGQVITARVAESGIPPCDAGNSASNPQWVLSADGWRQRFSGWINDSLPDDLLQVNIFFDLRTLAGDEELTEKLRRHIFAEVAARPIFLYYLAESTINFRLPADPLGRLRAEGPDGNVLNLKKVMLHFVSFVRIYALKHGLEANNTITRLETLAAGNLLPRDLALETLAAWRYLLERRFQAQMVAAAAGFSDHNLLFLDQLGHWEQTLVKMAAGHIANLQRRLSNDFTRAA